MSNKFAKNLFIYGSTICFLALVFLTIDTMGKLDKRAPDITAQVNAGKKVWHKYDCIGCHTIFGNGSYFAPDLTKAVERKPKGYLKKFILNPRAIKPKTAMPNLGLSEEEGDHLIAFLDWLDKVDTNGWPPKPILAVATAGKFASAGQMIFQKHDCVACHQIQGIGGTAGPDLTYEGTIHRDIEWHIRHLKNPESVVPDSAMPKFDHLSEEELIQLSEYLATLE